MKSRRGKVQEQQHLCTCRHIELIEIVVSLLDWTSDTRSQDTLICRAWYSAWITGVLC